MKIPEKSTICDNSLKYIYWSSEKERILFAQRVSIWLKLIDNLV